MIRNPEVLHGWKGIAIAIALGTGCASQPSPNRPLVQHEPKQTVPDEREPVNPKPVMSYLTVVTLQYTDDAEAEPRQPVYLVDDVNIGVGAAGFKAMMARLKQLPESTIVGVKWTDPMWDPLSGPLSRGGKLFPLDEETRTVQLLASERHFKLIHQSSGTLFVDTDGMIDELRKAHPRYPFK